VTAFDLDVSDTFEAPICTVTRAAQRERRHAWRARSHHLPNASAFPQSGLTLIAILVVTREPGPAARGTVPR